MKIPALSLTRQGRGTLPQSICKLEQSPDLRSSNRGFQQRKQRRQAQTVLDGRVVAAVGVRDLRAADL